MNRSTGGFSCNPRSLSGEIRPWRERGFQIAVHAIGDAAVREVLDVYERLGAEGPSLDARNRVEHAQVISPADMSRFAALGVIASMQFMHCTSDMPWAEARLGRIASQAPTPGDRSSTRGCMFPEGAIFPSNR